MAIMLPKNAQTEFFKVLFGKEWVDTNIEPLIAKGMEFNVGFTDITVKMTLGGPLYQQSCKLLVNTTSLMKNTANATVTNDARLAISNFIAQMKDQLEMGTWIANAQKGQAQGNGPLKVPTGKADYTFIKNVIKNDKIWSTTNDPFTADKVSPAQKMPDPAPPVGFMPVHTDEISATIETEYIPPPKKAMPKKPAPSGIVKLRNATVIGQKVKGTSPGSVYRLIAMNDRVKVATRIQGAAISVRAEFNNATQAEKIALQAMGLQPKGDSGDEYYSTHMGTDGVSPGRILGAFLLDVGVSFDDQVKNIKEIEND